MNTMAHLIQNTIFQFCGEVGFNYSHLSPKFQLMFAFPRGFLKLLTNLMFLLISLVLISCQQPKALQETQFIGIPGMSRPLVLDCTMGKDANGLNTLYLCTYSRGNNSGCTFMGVDPLTGAVKIQHDITGRIGPYHLATDSSGNVYASIYGSGQAELLLYDPKTDNLAILNAGLETEDFSFGLSANPSGGIIFGTHGEGKILTYNSDSKEIQDLGILIPGNKYPKAFLALAPDSILIGSGAPAHLSLFNPNTGQKRVDLLPQQYRNASFVYNLWFAGGYIWCRLAPSGLVLVLSKDDFSILAELDSIALSAPLELGNGRVLLKDIDNAYRLFDPTTLSMGAIWEVLPAVEGVSIFKIIVDGKEFLTGINSDGLWWRLDPLTKDLETIRLPLPSSSTRVTSLNYGPDDSLYAGTYETNSLFRYNSGQNNWKGFGNVSPGRTGEILAMTTLGSRLYTLSYIEAVLCSFDPKLPWQPGKDTRSNPREIGALGQDQNRPFDMCVKANGNIYMATFAGYGKTGGALSCFDPISDNISIWRGLNGAGNIYSLTSGAGPILFIGTSQVLEGLESLPGPASVLAFNVETEVLLDWRINLPESKTIDALFYCPSDLLDESRLYGIANGQCFSVNYPDTTVSYLDLPSVVGLVGNSQSVYAGGPSGVFTIDQGGDVTQVCKTGPDFSGAFAANDNDYPQLSFARDDSVFILSLY